MATQGFMVIMGSNEQLAKEVTDLLAQIKNYQYGNQDSIQMGL